MPSASGMLVAVGDSGVILHSPDGIVWTEATSGTSADLYSVRRLGGQFVTVGANGVILTSSDGVAWTVRPSGVSADLRSVGQGAGLIVAVGDGGAIVTSANGGGTWMAQPSATTEALTSVAWLKDRFVATRGDFAAMESPDGANWELAENYLRDHFWLKSFGDQLVGEWFTVVPGSSGDELMRSFAPADVSVPAFASYEQRYFSVISSETIEWILYVTDIFIGSGPVLMDAVWTGEQLVLVRGGGTILTLP